MHEILKILAKSKIIQICIGINTAGKSAANHAETMVMR